MGIKDSLKKLIGVKKKTVMPVKHIIRHKKVARKLSPREAIEFGDDTNVPESWQTRFPKRPEVTPPKSGRGRAHSPYTDLYLKKWGVEPIQDLKIYRNLLRTKPWVHKAIETYVHLSLSKGYDWIVPEANAPRAEEMLKDIRRIFSMVKTDFEGMVLPQIVNDMLVYGSAFVEQIYAGGSDREDEWDTGKEEKLTVYGAEEGLLVNIKALDPVYMRCRVDQYGNVFGYVQRIGYPYVAFHTNKIVQFKYMPRSTPYERNYGTSLLMSLIRTEDFIESIEKDILIAGHSIVRPPLLIKNPENEELSDEEWDEIISQRSSAFGGDDVIAYNADIEPLPIPANAISGLVEFYKLMREDRALMLGVPRDILGIQKSGNTRATSEVNWSIFISKLKGIQSHVGNFVLHDIVFPALKRYGWKENEIYETLPEMKWNDIAIEDLEKVSEQKRREFRAGIISRNEAREALRLHDTTEDKWIEEVEHYGEELRGNRPD